MTADQDEGQDTPRDEAHDPPQDEGHDALQDAKARFREALDRKQATAHRDGEARRNSGSVHGSEVAGSTRRTFRRKTG